MRHGASGWPGPGLGLGLGLGGAPSLRRGGGGGHAWDGMGDGDGAEGGVGIWWSGLESSGLCLPMVADAGGTRYLNGVAHSSMR